MSKDFSQMSIHAADQSIHGTPKKERPFDVHIPCPSCFVQSVRPCDKAPEALTEVWVLRN